ncbi:MAG: hypothetical protein NC394_01315 [Bacteroides sp.]|nr:hypothetical protein [Bacteroides sp.]
MITQIDIKTAQRLLSDANDIFSVKIAANLKAYKDYDFFSVYGGKGVLIGRYYNDLVIRTKGVISEDTMEELSLFLKVCGFSSALCGAETGKRLEALGWSDTEEGLIYKFSSHLIPENAELPEMEEIEKNPQLDAVFPIIRDGFPDIKYDDWYTDINHKIRHGVSNVYVYEGASATAIADINGTVFISLVAAKSEARGKGGAKKLLGRLGLYFESLDRETVVLCREELSPFYRKVGFYECGKAVTVFNAEKQKH